MGMRRRLRIALLCTAFAALPPVCTAAGQPDPVPASVGPAARCYLPGTIVLVWPPFGDCEVTILRAPAGGEPTEIARVTLGTGHYLDAGLAPLARYEYTVRPAKGDALGPVPASNSPEMLVGGDFEGLEPGETTSTPMFHRAYGPPWWDVVELARPGGEGKLALKIRHGTPPRRDGLHSRLLPVDPRGAYRQTGWQRVLPGAVAESADRFSPAT